MLCWSHFHLLCLAHERRILTHAHDLASVTSTYGNSCDFDKYECFTNAITTYVNTVLVFVTRVTNSIIFFMKKKRVWQIPTSVFTNTKYEIFDLTLLQWGSTVFWFFFFFFCCFLFFFFFFLLLLLLLLFCSSGVDDSPEISKFLNTLFLFSAHFCFVIGFTRNVSWISYKTSSRTE